MTLRLPQNLRQHPLESLLAAGLLLTLVIGASDRDSQKTQSNQTVSACHRSSCTTQTPAG
ncbi:MAG TPA: hypothetical protein VNU97_01605 [Rhizomicrobium sp.]|jgi:hypothetical protein|nr:hypothetical protein [Rhizomicrobium sp.]